jgi:AcrR family transcriptional regulator
MRPLTADDLTARAGIRDAALVQFAERGVASTTMRAIAAHAGVSPGLVQQHFGSKDGLREACDRDVQDLVRREASQMVDERVVGVPAFIAEASSRADPSSHATWRAQSSMARRPRQPSSTRFSR